MKHPYSKLLLSFPLSAAPLLLVMACDTGSSRDGTSASQAALELGDTNGDGVLSNDERNELSSECHARGEPSHESADEAAGADGEADMTGDEVDGADGTADGADGTADAADGTADGADGTADATDSTADATDSTADATDSTADATDSTADAPDGTMAADSVDGEVAADGTGDSEAAGGADSEVEDSVAQDEGSSDAEIFHAVCVELFED